MSGDCGLALARQRFDEARGTLVFERSLEEWLLLSPDVLSRLLKLLVVVDSIFSSANVTSSNF